MVIESLQFHRIYAVLQIRSSFEDLFYHFPDKIMRFVKKIFIATALVFLFQYLNIKLPIITKITASSLNFSYLGVIFIAPLLEETIFRGYIQTTLAVLLIFTKYAMNQLYYKKDIPIRWDHILTSSKKISQMVVGVLFGLMHLVNPLPDAVRLTQTALAIREGLYYGKLKDERGLIPPIVSHSLNNFLACLLIWQQ